jgi:hypothetical protein
MSIRALNTTTKKWLYCTTYKSWNSKTDRGGSLFSIVFDDHKYYALPYWDGNRPEAEIFISNYYYIVVSEAEIFISDYYYIVVKVDMPGNKIYQWRRIPQTFFCI